MRFTFIAKHRGIWPVAWLCEALGVSRSGFHAWLHRSPSQHARYDEALLDKIKISFKDSDRTYGARRVRHDLLAEGFSRGLHRVERLMRDNALIRRMADPDSLAFPKRSKSESLAQTGGLRCDQGFHYVRVLMETVFGGWRGRRRTQPRRDACWHSL